MFYLWFKTNELNLLPESAPFLYMMPVKGQIPVTFEGAMEGLSYNVDFCKEAATLDHMLT